MSEVIVITSGKGGVGKTTTSANVGTGLAVLGKRVVLIDTDIGLRNLDVVMGLENRIVYNLVDVVEGGCRMKQALIRDKRYPNLYLLPSAQTRDKSAVNPEQMIKLTDDLRSEFDYILLDCPAGIEQGFYNAIAGADRALVVTTPEVSAIRDADRIIGLLGQAGIREIDLVLNRIRGDMVRRGDMMSLSDVTDILAVSVIGAVPDDENIVISTNQGEPLVGMGSAAGKAYFSICRRLLGENVPMEDPGQADTIMARLRRAFRRAGCGKVGFMGFSSVRRSGETARMRLKLILVSDKAGCPPEMILMIRDDMIHAVSKYMEIEKDSVRLLMDTDSQPAGKSGGLAVLHADIPIRSISNKGLY